MPDFADNTKEYIQTGSAYNFVSVLYGPIYKEVIFASYGPILYLTVLQLANNFGMIFVLNQGEF